MSTDQDQLSTLGILHYVLAGITALFSCFALIYVGLGYAFLAHPHTFQNAPGAPPPPPFIGWLFLVMGGVFFLLGETLAVLMLMAGRCLRGLRRHTFVLVVAGLDCFFMPFGTVLGVFTLMALTKPQVKALFVNPGSGAIPPPLFP